MIEVKTLPPPDDLQPVRRALISVYDKTGLIPFAQRLIRHGITIISTGGTAKALEREGIAVTEVTSLTGFPEILGGRVKTLHPAVHAGLLARRNDRDDLSHLAELQIEPIDLVVVNLYPFTEVVAREDITEAEAIENIDIGGPTMVRAAAKNYYFVGVVSSPSDYDTVADELDRNGGMLPLKVRRDLSKKAFQLTARYDQAITEYFAGSEPAEQAALPDRLQINLPRSQELRYGENPHQKAAFYGDTSRLFEQLHGKELSFNNLIDLDAGLALIDEFHDDDPTCAILKHTNPCGVATAASLTEAYELAFATDQQSPFGGIVVFNRPLDRMTAEAVDRIFTELIIAPGYEEGVLDFLMQKKNRRLILTPQSRTASGALNIRSAVGGLLVQEKDPPIPPLADIQSQWKVVTRRAPDPDEWADIYFAWRVVKHVKSNAILFARNGRTLGIGAGQMSRIDSSEIAVIKAGKSELDLSGSVVASDAFYPFPDGLEAAARVGARTAVQPGGSVRDQEVIDAADREDVAMVFTGNRHFRH